MTNKQGPSSVARLEGRGQANVDDPLARNPFLNQLRLEKRRVDRSKAPLSMVLYRHDGKKGELTHNVRMLLKLLRASKRETDILGQLDNDVIAILLLDTNQDGMKRFMEKVVSEGGDLPFSMGGETYPNHLFENVLRGSEFPVDFQSFVLDDSAGPHFIGLLAKRAFDIVVTATMILLALPLMLVVAFAVARTSPGPIIFRQTRLGKGCAPFVFYKFRSMSVNVDDTIHREFVTTLIKGGHKEINQQDAANPLYKIKCDPRLTPIGGFIRKTSLDELPQLFNVLKGDMSLVGPRPPLPYEAEKYQAWHLRRILEIKPGITGLWQVEGRSKVSFDEMVRMDLRYTRDWSLLLDLKILTKTVAVVLRREGAT
jgi:lipopolysaccharide/colanic/teichoic acid biosynthesis glycosyltransferase